MSETMTRWSPVMHERADVLLGLLATAQGTAALDRVRHLGGKGSVADFEAHALYRLAAQFDYPGASFLEIGTLRGRTAAVMAQAAPQALIETLNPAEHEWQANMRDLRPWSNVIPSCAYSWDWLADAIAHPWRGDRRDLIFVDGDHKQFARDLPWWNRLAVGGLFVVHDCNDYQSPPVLEGMERLAALVGRPFDVLITDPDRVGRGLAGMYRRECDPDWTGS